ncbi:MAG: Tm-1-like ATP-binding domain-containing protein [Planctomycetaceae bacterium]|nr:Tm-1-like ATP-binding domain-containing protein [Planctomycetaceae bacterium]
MTKSVYVLATLDTKGLEAAFVRDQLARLKVPAQIVDTGCVGAPSVEADIPRDEIFKAAGTTLAALREKNDRGEAVKAAAKGASVLIKDLYDRGDVGGVLGLGGSAGTIIGTSAMRALPIGVPKVMVSTLASGTVRQFVGDKDILMLNSIVDILGINRISRPILTNAARAVAGMVALPAAPVEGADKPLVAVTMFGVTTKGVMRAKETLEKAGYEVLVFHATGNGGQAMETLIAEGLIAGVLDLTTTELADELCGGFLTAGPERLTAAGKAGVPQVVSVGAVDMVNFYAPDSVPAKYKGRKLYPHNPVVTLMRTTPEENARIGADLGAKVAAAKGPKAILLPRKGVSAIDAAGQPFDDPEARLSLFSAIRTAAKGVEIVELDAHINDPEFADAAATKLLGLMKVGKK